MDPVIKQILPIPESLTAMIRCETENGKKYYFDDSYMVYGHIHNSTAAGFWPLIRGNPHMLNAGVDVNGFLPVTLDEMIQNNEMFKAREERPSEEV